MPRCPLDLLVAVLLTSLCHQGWAQQTLVIVTKEDLVEMTQEGLPESLIIKAVESADRVPTLQPKELTELVAKGVSTYVLEAAIERRRELQRPAIAVPERREPGRRVRVTARLDNRQKWFRRLIQREGTFTVYWAAVVGEPGREGKAPIRGCIKDPVCWCTDSTGQRRCIGPEDLIWRRYFSCLRIVEVSVSETHEIFDLDLDPEPEAIRILPYFMVKEKDGSLHLELWNTSRDDPGSGKSKPHPGYVLVSPGNSRDFTAIIDVGLELRGSAETDFRLLVTQFDNRDSSAEPPPQPVGIGTEAAKDFLPERLSECPPSLGPG